MEETFTELLIFNCLFQEFCLIQTEEQATGEKEIIYFPVTNLFPRHDTFNPCFTLRSTNSHVQPALQGRTCVLWTCVKKKCTL